MASLLLIAHENEDRQQISNFLAQAEYDVYHTNNLEFASTLIRQQDEIRLIIGDVAMFVGNITPKELRQLKGHCALVVFTDTANLPKLEPLKGEIEAILVKPLQKQVLLDSILKCLIKQVQKSTLQAVQSQIFEQIQALLDMLIGQSSANPARNVDKQDDTLIPPAIAAVSVVRELTIDYGRSVVAYKGKALPLTPTEFDVMSLLIQEAGRVVTFEEIVYILQKQKLTRNDARRMLSAHITNLRTKMRDAGCDHYLINSRGRGYMIESDVETSLKTKDMQLHVLLDQVPILIWTTDTQLTLTSMTGDFVMDQLNRNPDDVIGVSLYDFWQNTSNIPAITAHLRALKGETVQYEQNWRGRIFQSYVQPIYEDIEIVGCVGIGVDITEHKSVEEQLRNSQHFSEQIIRTNPNLIYVYDLIEERIIYIHKLVHQMFGYTPEDAQEPGYAFFEAVIHPEDFYFIQESAHRFKHVADNEVLHREIRMRRADGEWGWFRLREVVFARDEQGQPSQILGNVEDITERRNEQQVLREEKIKFQAVWHRAADAMVLSDDTGTVINANQAYLEFYGYSADEIIGKNFSLIFSEERRAQANQDYKTVFAEDHSVGTFEIPVKRKDGVERIVEAKATFIRLENDDRLMLSIIRDVTEYKQAAERFKQGSNHFRMISELVTDYAYGFEVTQEGLLHLDWITGDFEEVVGFTGEKLVKRGGWSSILYPEDLPIAMKRLENLLAGIDDTSEFRIINAANKIRWLRDYAHPIWNTEMTHIIYIVGAAQDITNTK